LGVAIASLLEITNRTYILICSFIFVTLLIAYWDNKRKMFFVICLLLLFLGMSRYTISFPEKRIRETKKEVVGYISAEPDVRMDGVRYIVMTEDIGRVYVKSFLYPRYNYGDTLKLKCNIQIPEQIEDFRYDMYLARYKVFAICGNGFITDIGEIDGSFILRNIYLFKNIIAKKINLLWHEPHASFMAGLLYGYRGGLGSLNELFSRTGVTHIVAISGYNITIISTILSSILVQLSIPRKKAFYFIVSGITVFVIFAGLSASVVRAGVMGIVVLMARQSGRSSRVGNVLVLTAVIMTVQNPLILMWDAGFQLSFISTLGLVYVSPLFSTSFKKIPETLGLRESIEATLSATIATLPLILFQFKRLSVVAVIVNVLILWIIPLLMLLGFLAVVMSFIFIPLANIIAWLAWVGLSYIIFIVKWFAGLSFAAVDIQIPWWGMVVSYLLIIYMCKRPNKKTPFGV